MSINVEQISRQDPDFMKHVYRIRKTVFEEELGYPPKDRVVINEWDSLSNHYILICNGHPSGTVSMVDLTGLRDILETHGVDPSLRVVKATKLAILPEARGVRSVKILLAPVFGEMERYDFVVGHVGPPSNNVQDLRLLRMGEKYSRLFGAQQIGRMELDGLPMKVYGLDLRDKGLAENQ